MQNNYKAVFLDRDGVIIEDVHYLSKLDDVSIYKDVPQNLKKLKEHGFQLIVITNQSGVARGYFTEDFVEETHRYINESLTSYDVKLDAFYYCPHHLDGNPPYNISCDCRKPKTSLVLKAAKLHGIDLSQSYMVGDKTSDIGLAVNSGLKGILVKTGHGIKHVEKVASSYPDTLICKNFSDAVDFILQKK